MSYFELEEAAAHHFDQSQAEVLSALRKERKGFFVALASGDTYGFSVTGTGEELEQFLLNVIASAEKELEQLREVLP